MFWWIYIKLKELYRGVIRRDDLIRWRRWFSRFEDGFRITIVLFMIDKSQEFIASFRNHPASTLSGAFMALGGRFGGWSL